MFDAFATVTMLLKIKDFNDSIVDSSKLIYSSIFSIAPIIYFYLFITCNVS